MNWQVTGGAPALWRFFSFLYKENVAYRYMEHLVHRLKLLPMRLLCYFITNAKPLFKNQIAEQGWYSLLIPVALMPNILPVCSRAVRVDFKITHGFLGRVTRLHPCV